MKSHSQSLWITIKPSYEVPFLITIKSRKLTKNTGRWWVQICPWQARATPRLGRQDRSALQGQAWNRWVIGWWFDMDYLWIIYGLSPWLFGLPMDYDNIWINYDIYIYTAWWFGTWLDYDFPFSWECHHPDWRTPSFFRGAGIPPTRYYLIWFLILFDMIDSCFLKMWGHDFIMIS